ncbi:MAG: MarR family transcriptional regulator [Bacteroidales bacterium]|nr:MarR family transcriptional regulator [Bacteroidales bacterium]
MNKELQTLIDLFLKILHLYSVINKKPKDYGTGDLLYFTEIHTITMVGKNKKINVTRLAEVMGVTKGAISQTIKKLVSKNLILKTNLRNRKEVNLKLSEKGRLVYKGQKSFQKDIFTFAAALYKRGTPEQRDLVRRLFIEIVANMQMRVKVQESAG